MELDDYHILQARQSPNDMRNNVGKLSSK